MSFPPVSLEVVGGKARGTMIPVGDELMIGRHADGLGRLADDQEISRLHARVSLDSSGLCAIEDLGSTNGTFVNGLRISTRQTLSDGDTVELGDTTLIVRRSAVPAPPETNAPIEPDAPLEGDEPEAPNESAAGTGSEDAARRVSDPLAPTEVYEPEAAQPEAPAAPDPYRAPPTALGAAPVEALAIEPEAAPVEPLAVDPMAVDVPPGAPSSIEAPADAFPPPLSLWVEVDFAARTTLIRLDDHSPPIRLAHVDGTWRQVPPAD